MRIRESDLPNFLLCNGHRLYPLIRDFPVLPTGFKHSNTKPNAGYRRAELELWNAVANGHVNKTYMFFVWQLYAQTLHRMCVRFDKMKGETQ